MYLYEIPISLYSFKLRLAIALKGAAMETRLPPGGSYRSAEFRSINPAGSIPVLVDGDLMLAESDAIIEYLDDKNVGVTLLPSDPQLRARTRMMSRWCDFRLEPPVRALFPMVKPENRDSGIIAAADTRISAALALFEQTLDDQGPFAIGAKAGLVDCGLVATLAWLPEIAPRLKLASEPGWRVARTIDAMRSSDATGEMIRAYQALVVSWVTDQLG